MRVFNEAIITAGDMSGSLNSSTVHLDSIYAFSVQAVWTGTSPVGTLKLQASDDFLLNPGDAVTNWIDIAGASAAVSGNTGSQMFNYNGAGFQHVRLVYTFTSGVGTLNARIFNKGV